MRVYSRPFPPNVLRTVARIAGTLVIFACRDSTSPPAVPAKYIVSSSESSPVAGSQVTIRAQLVDADDKQVAIGGRTLTWTSTSAGVQPRDTSSGIVAVSLTLADGSASTAFLTNTVAGVTHRISVIDASGIKGAAADITTVVGPGAAYTVTPSTNQPVVGSGVLISAQLTDHYQNPSKTAGRVVTWSSTGIGGSFSSPTSTTNSDGIATVTFNVGTIAGSDYTVSAKDDMLAGGVSSFFETTAGLLAKYILNVSVIDPPAGADIVVYAQASDANGNPVVASGRLLTWSTTGSGGSFASPSTGTDAYGLATVTFTAGTVAGTTYTISAKDAAGFGGSAPDITTLPHVSLASMAIGVGALSSCGIATDGKAWCWGANDFGALGNGTTVDRSLPGMVSGSLMMTSLSAGFDHACGVTTSGVVECWGDNSSGQLGDNTVSWRSVPAPLASSLTATSVTAGTLHTCALVAGGDVYCWGSNSNGRLGAGNQPSGGIVKVLGGLSFASITAGGSHTCGVTTAGDAYCWGANDTGQLGDNSFMDRSAPVAVAGGFKFISVSAGVSHTCGIVVGGAAYCWGDDTYGQLGHGTPTGRRLTPAPVAGGLSFVAVSAGGFQTCGITTSSTAACWGDNFLPPTAVPGGLLFKSISAGGALVACGSYCGPDFPEDHTCGLTTTGVAYCWGSNNRGELAQGPTVGGTGVPLKVRGQP